MSEPKKNQTFTTYMVLEDSLNPGKAKINPTIAAGDFQRSGDGAAFANMTNLPTLLPAASEMVQLILTAAEMNFDRLVVRARDAAGAQWEEQILEIQTLASTLADVAAKTNLLNFDASNYVKSVQQYPTGAVVADGGNSSLQFKSDRSEAVDGYWEDGPWIQMTSGALINQIQKISTYNGTTKIFVLTSSFTGVPAAADTFKIITE
ncbi:MAG: hypothetical protein ABGX83_05230 [Nitrospira sp.]